LGFIVVHRFGVHCRRHFGHIGHCPLRRISPKAYYSVFFRAPNFETAWAVLNRFAVPAPLLLMTATNFALVMAFLTAAHVLFYRLDLKAMTARMNPIAFACAYGAVVAVILPFVDVEVQPFIYFQF
jgi:hypothetical protein